MESDGNRNLSRRAVLAMPLLAAGFSVLEQPSLPSEAQGTKPRPFLVNIPEATIKHLLNRVRDTRWPNRLEAMDWRYGANWDYMKALAQYWTTRYDWRKAEASLNRYPQFLARVSDFDILTHSPEYWPSGPGSRRSSGRGCATVSDRCRRACSPSYGLAHQQKPNSRYSPAHC